MRLPAPVRLPARRVPRLPDDFYRRHALWPTITLFGALLAFQLWPIDTYIAHRWAFDSLHERWLGRGRWWAEVLLHKDGRAAILLVIGGLLATLGAGLASPRFQAARSTALYLLVTIALAWGITGLLKHVTNVPCPWSLAGFGGERPDGGLFDPRPAGYAAAACFPGAHSASGFALFAFYFAWRERHPRRALVALGGAALVGVAFAFAQEARGAHFLSHDVCSALLSWVVALATYLGWRRVRVAAGYTTRAECRLAKPRRALRSRDSRRPGSGYVAGLRSSSIRES